MSRSVRHVPVRNRILERVRPQPPTTSVRHVTRRSLVKLGGAEYSVWTDWIKLAVKAYVGVEMIEIVGPDDRVVVHPRVPSGQRSIDYRHYLPELAKKPQALRQVASELIENLGAPYDRLWRELCDARGPKQAARVFAHVLRAVVELGDRVVAERVRGALDAGEPVLLALRPSSTPPTITIDAVPAMLRDVEIFAGRAADYDHLLGGVS